LEFIVILWLFITALKLNKYWAAFTIGYTQHMVFDIFTNPIGLKGYSLIYRFYHKFETEKLIDKSILQKRIEKYAATKK